MRDRFGGRRLPGSSQQQPSPPAVSPISGLYTHLYIVADPRDDSAVLCAPPGGAAEEDRALDLNARLLEKAAAGLKDAIASMKATADGLRNGTIEAKNPPARALGVAERCL